MSNLGAKLRGVMGIGLAWGVVWAAIFAALLAVIAVLRPEEIGPGEGPRIAVIRGSAGIASGVAFGLLLSLAEMGRAILDLSWSRAALWGTLGSAVFPLLAQKQDQISVMCPMGAAVSVALVAIARKAELRTSERPKSLRDVLFAYVRASVRDALGPAREPST